jgi:hypothetical protein
MATVDGPKYTGPLIIDLSDLKDDLVDLAHGSMKGFRTEGEGIDKVITELAQAMPAHGDAAEISTVVYQRFVNRNDRITLLRDRETTLAKALEVCRETRAKQENDREDDIGIMAKSVQDAARRAKNPGITAPFEQTIKYNARIAEKALATRRKNEEAKAEAAKNPAGEGGG